MNYYVLTILYLLLSGPFCAHAFKDPTSVIYNEPDLDAIEQETLSSFVHPEYGTLFQYQNRFMHNLQTRYLHVAIRLPNPNDLTKIFFPPKHDCSIFLPTASYWKSTDPETGKEETLYYNAAHKTCENINSLHARYRQRIADIIADITT